MQFLEQGARIEILAGQVDRVGFQACGLEQVVHQVAQPAAAVKNGIECTLAGLVKFAVLAASAAALLPTR